MRLNGVVLRTSGRLVGLDVIANLGANLPHHTAGDALASRFYS